MAYLKDEIKAGVIIVISLVLLSAFTILVGGTQFFEKYDTYYVKLLNAAGLEPGSQIRLGGVRAGKIMDIKPPTGPGEPVTITLGLNMGTDLFEGTKAFITQVGFVGDAYLLLSIVETSGEKIAVGETIPSVESVDFKLLMVKVNDIAKSLDTLLNDIDRLFSEKTVDSIEELISSTSDVLKELNGLVGDNKGEITQLISNAGDTVKALEDAANSISSTSRTVGETVDLQSDNITNLLTSLTETTEDLQEVLQEIKQKPWSLIYKEQKGKNE